MAILNISESQESDIQPLPIGTYPGVISAIWDIGKQKKEWQGEVSIINQLMIRIEVSKTISAPGSEYDGKRYAPTSWVTVPRAFSDKANIVKIASAALGKTMGAPDFAQFDTDALIGKNLVVTVGHTTSGKAKITGFSPAMDGITPMTPELTTEMPEWVKKMVNAGLEGEQPQQDLPPASAYNNMPPAPEGDLPF